MVAPGKLNLRIEPTPLDPAPDLVHRLAALAAASGATGSARPVRTAPPGWQVGLAAAGVAGIVGGGAWLAASIGGGDESTPPSPVTTPGQGVVPSTTAAEPQRRVHRDRTLQPVSDDQGDTGIATQPSDPLSPDDPNDTATAPVDPPAQGDGTGAGPGDDGPAPVPGDGPSGGDGDGGGDGGGDGSGDGGGSGDGSGGGDGSGSGDSSGSGDGRVDDGAGDDGADGGAGSGDVPDGDSDAPSPPSTDD